MTSAACRAVMMAVRERAAKAMAAVDRRVPSLDDFVGQSWTAWADWAGVSGADGKEAQRSKHEPPRGRLTESPQLISSKTERGANRVTQTKTCRVLARAGCRAPASQISLPLAEMSGTPSGVSATVMQCGGHCVRCPRCVWRGFIWGTSRTAEEAREHRKASNFFPPTAS